jgi:hypothetical protein
MYYTWNFETLDRSNYSDFNFPNVQSQDLDDVYYCIHATRSEYESTRVLRFHARRNFDPLTEF